MKQQRNGVSFNRLMPLFHHDVFPFPSPKELVQSTLAIKPCIGAARHLVVVAGLQSTTAFCGAAASTTNAHSARLYIYIHYVLCKVCTIYLIIYLMLYNVQKVHAEKEHFRVSSLRVDFYKHAKD